MILSEKARERARESARIGQFFSLGSQLRREGKRPVDLILGNPYDKPETRLYEALEATLAELSISDINPHRYMENVGFYATRERCAEYMNQTGSVEFKARDILMTAGCANGLDVSLAALIEPDIPAEVIILTPGFMEHQTYVSMNRGTPVLVPMTADFEIDFDALDAAVTPHTRAIILNFPNNPTGAILSDFLVHQLTEFLDVQSSIIGHPIVVMEDSPYDQIFFDLVPKRLISTYPHTLFVTSFSKSHGLAGERLGFIAVHPDWGINDERDDFMRILSASLRCRVVNAPSLMQRLIARMGCHRCIDLEGLKNRVRKMEYGLLEQGFRLKPAEGAFYVFAQLPDCFPDFARWNEMAMAGPEPLLTVPGWFFGGARYERYLRFSATVSDEDIDRALRRIREICHRCRTRAT